MSFLFFACFFDFVSGFSVGSPVFVCWIFVHLMSPMISIAMQLIEFHVFHTGCWWSCEFCFTSGGCLSITEKINLFRVSNWSSVSPLNEYTVANVNVLKSFM